MNHTAFGDRLTDIGSDEVKGGNMENHEHPAAPDAVTVQPAAPRASDAAMVVQLNARLNQKAQELRVMEDREVCLAALANDQQSEIIGLRAMVDQVVTENKVLRKRLGLPELGAIEALPEDGPVIDAVPVEEQQHPDN